MNYLITLLNRIAKRKDNQKEMEVSSSIPSKNGTDRYTSATKPNILLDTPSNEGDVHDYQHGSPSFINEICKEYDNESNMLQRLMNTKESNNERQSSNTDDEFRLSMPLQHDDSKKQLKNQSKPNITQHEENELYNLYQNQINNIRESRIGGLRNEEKSELIELANTSVQNSQYPAPATVTTSRMQTAARTNYHESINVQTINNRFPEIVEEENSINSYNGKLHENNYRRKIPSPFYDQESVYQSISDQNITLNNQQKTAMRYSEQTMQKYNYEPKNDNTKQAQGFSNQNQMTRNRNHFQKSSEFTFVGQRLAQSPHENCGTQQVCDLTSMSRQSIILNPLTDVNPTSTTKKSNAGRNISYINNPHRMTNIEEENIERQSEYENDDQVNQYYGDENNNIDNGNESSYPEGVIELTNQNFALQNLVDQYSSK